MREREGGREREEGWTGGRRGGREGERGRTGGGREERERGKEGARGEIKKLNKSEGEGDLKRTTCVWLSKTEAFRKYVAESPNDSTTMISELAFVSLEMLRPVPGRDEEQKNVIIVT